MKIQAMSHVDCGGGSIGRKPCVGIAQTDSSIMVTLGRKYSQMYRNSAEIMVFYFCRKQRESGPGGASP